MQGMTRERAFLITAILRINEYHEEKGRIFAGKILFMPNGIESVSGFAGAVGRDGRTLSITGEYWGTAPGRSWGKRD